MATIAQALRMALHVGETRLGVTDIFGETSVRRSAASSPAQGLEKAWGCRSTGGIVVAFGLALAGQRPVAEIQFCDYIFNTIDLLKLVGNCSWVSNGQFPVPLVMMTPVGSGIHGSLYHSHSFDAMATHIQGWKIVLPSTPIDVYGLMIAAIKDPNPVMFLYPKALIRVPGVERIPGEPTDPRALSRMIDAPLGKDREHWSPQWPELPDSDPIGRQFLSRGEHITVVTYGRTLRSLRAAGSSRGGDIRAEVIDLRTLFPYDRDAILVRCERPVAFYA